MEKTIENLEWNVYIEDFNSRCIKKFNIFDHYFFVEDVVQLYEEYKVDFNSFYKEIDRVLRYYFWSKCEWEIILSDWPPSDKFKEEKISIYDQIKLNYDVFIKYVWEELNRED